MKKRKFSDHKNVISP